MSTIEGIIRMRKSGMRRAHAHKRIRIRRLSPSVSVWDIEAKVQEMAEEEENMTRYEHGLEVA